MDIPPSRKDVVHHTAFLHIHLASLSINVIKTPPQDTPRRVTERKMLINTRSLPRFFAVMKKYSRFDLWNALDNRPSPTVFRRRNFLKNSVGGWGHP